MEKYFEGQKLTKLCSVATVNIEGLVALVDLSEGRIEDQTVGTEPFLGYSIAALVVFVALHLILVRTIFVVWALKLLGAWKRYRKKCQLSMRRMKIKMARHAAC